MKTSMEFENDRIRIKGLGKINLEHIFECGQCFRWNRTANGHYVGVVRHYVVEVAADGDDLVIKGPGMEVFNDLLHDYFDLDTDYGKIREQLARIDEPMAQATSYGYGIRILNQEPWETLISFIISGNNNIPRIKKSIELMCRKYGTFIESKDGIEYYNFPEPEVIANLSVEAIRELGVGYRDKYIRATAVAIASGEVDLSNLHLLSYDDGKKELMKLMGVGSKVADCILLFSMRKRNAFPVDTWVKKVMHHYYGLEGQSNETIRQYGENHFGHLSGYAQQYLFFYARESKI